MPLIPSVYKACTCDSAGTDLFRPRPLPRDRSASKSPSWSEAQLSYVTDLLSHTIYGIIYRVRNPELSHPTSLGLTY